MSRFDTAYLVLEDTQGTGVFELSIELEPSGQLEKSFLMSSRGQYITAITNILPETGEIDSIMPRRAGFYVDGGAGDWIQTLSFTAGTEEDSIQWGDGSGGTGEANVTQRDASGAGINPQTRKDILELWLAKTKTDSRNPARLYFGEWTNGDYHSESGVFNQPMPVAVQSFDLSNPPEESSDMTGSITVAAITPFADYDPPDWLSNSNIGTFIENVADELSGVQER